MNNELQQPLSEPQPHVPSVTPEVTSSKPKKSSKKLWIVLGAVGGILCLCAIAYFFLLRGVEREMAPVGSVLDSYMKSMAAKDTESAYALFSARAQRQIPISQLQDLIEGSNYFVFEGYQSLAVQNLEISRVTDTDPDVPQGMVAEASGTITYVDGTQGTFNGVLEKVDGKWQIDGIYVTTPPSKLQP